MRTIVLFFLLANANFRCLGEDDFTRWEAGAFLSTLDLRSPVGEKPGGLGIRTGYNFSRYAALESEYHWYPKNTQGNFGQRQFVIGVKAGSESEWQSSIRGCSGRRRSASGSAEAEDGARQREMIRNLVGDHARLVTCLARWNKQDPAAIIPGAIKANIGLYGFTKPTVGSLLLPVERFLSSPVDSYKEDDRNIAALARVYSGLPLDYVKRKAS